jgi:hypothetical protein
VKMADAIRALDARKESVFGGEFSTNLGEVRARQMFIGTDVDVVEAMAWAKAAACVFAIPLCDGEIDPVTALKGSWLDGLLTGLVFADLRSREDS